VPRRTVTDSDALRVGWLASSLVTGWVVTVRMNTNARNGENSDKERGRHEAMRRTRRARRARRTRSTSSSSYEYVLSTRISQRTHAPTRPSLLMATLPRSGALPSTGTLASGRHPRLCLPAVFPSHVDRTTTARRPHLYDPDPRAPGHAVSSTTCPPPSLSLSLYPLERILAAPLRLINPFIVSSIHGCHHNTEGARPALAYAPHGSSPAFEYNRKRAAVAAAAHAGHGWRSVWSAHVEADRVSGRGGERFLGGRTHQPAALAGFAGGY